jgi:hypothetical protein
MAALNALAAALRRTTIAVNRGTALMLTLIIVMASLFDAFGATALTRQPSAAPPAQAKPQTFKAEELDRLLAPIALYPDDLIAEILTGATYPLEIVMASRWIADPKNAALRGDALARAVQGQGWDPAVKSLAAFLSVLKTMSSNLDWTLKLGDAFIAQPQDCMAAVQRLRARASRAGKLTSTPQQKVTRQGDTIVVAPANPQIVYVPAYNPAVVYGSWPYPALPPYAFPPPVGYGVAAGLATGLAFGAGVAVANNLWGWGHINWGGGTVNVNVNRFNWINNNRAGFISGATWHHDPVHRQGVAYRNAATRARFGRHTLAGAASRRDFRGFAARGGAAIRPAAGGHIAAGNRAAGVRRSATRRTGTSVFHVGNGAQTRAFAQRGSFSRQQISARFQRGGFHFGGFRGRR